MKINEKSYDVFEKFGIYNFILNIVEDVFNFFGFSKCIVLSKKLRILIAYWELIFL